MAITRKKKVGSTLAGGLSGAAAGASLGSIFPGLGTIVGGTAGGLVGLLSTYLGTEPTEEAVLKAANKLSKKQIKDLEKKIKSEKKATNPSKEKIDQYQKDRADIEKKLITKDQVARGEVGNTNLNEPSERSIIDRIWNGDNNGLAANLTPQKTQAQSDILKYALNQLQNESQYDFGPIEKLTMQNFQQQIAPDILEGLTGGAAYAALGRAGSDLSTKLAAFRQDVNSEKQKSNRDLFRYGLAQLENSDTAGNKGLRQNLEQAFSNPENLKNFGNSLMDMYKNWSNNRSNNNSNAVQPIFQPNNNQISLDQQNQSNNINRQQPQQQLSTQQLSDIGNQLKFNPGNYNQNMNAQNILGGTNYLPKSKSFSALRGL